MLALVKKFPIIAAALIFVSPPFTAPAFSKQTQASAEQLDKAMTVYLQKIKDADGTYSTTIGDVDEKLLQYLKNACSNPILMTAPLTKCKELGLRALASGDGQTRFFSWDTNTGGSMHYFDSLVQYIANGKTYCAVLTPDQNGKEPPETGYDFNDVRSVKTKDGKSIYLATYSQYFSHPESCRSIKAFAVVGTKLVPIKVFQTKSQLLDQIDCPLSNTVEYNEHSLVKISKDGQTVLVPIITKDNVVTGHYLSYKFDGSKFVFDPKAK